MDHFPAASTGRANGALNALHIGGSFAVHFSVGQVIGCWPATVGHDPERAYQAGLLLAVLLQAAALAWFAGSPRGSLPGFGRGSWKAGPHPVHAKSHS